MNFSFLVNSLNDSIYPTTSWTSQCLLCYHIYMPNKWCFLCLISFLTPKCSTGGQGILSISKHFHRNLTQNNLGALSFISANNNKIKRNNNVQLSCSLLFNGFSKTNNSSSFMQSFNNFELICVVVFFCLQFGHFGFVTYKKSSARIRTRLYTL